MAEQQKPVKGLLYFKEVEGVSNSHYLELSFDSLTQFNDAVITLQEANNVPFVAIDCEKGSKTLVNRQQVLYLVVLH